MRKEGEGERKEQEVTKERREKWTAAGDKREKREAPKVN